MKLKYYLRGLGVGIICTAIIMGIALSGNKRETLTDAEIIERARLLGMVMEEEASGSKKQDSEQPGAEDGKTPDNQGTAGEQPDSGKADDVPDGSAESGAPESEDPDKAGSSESEDPDEADSPDSEQSDRQDGADGQETIKLEIKQGEFSDVVSRKLFQAGLVPNAEEFNAYMTQKGVDDSLRVGVHLIPAGSTADEIIAILVTVQPSG